MILRYCASCFARHREGFTLCFPCRDELYDLKNDVHDEIPSCYRYGGVLRRLVLRAKVHGDHRAVGLLTDLVLDHPFVKDWAEGIDVLIPAPSSLWSRTRGRLDLAALITHAVARRHGLKVEAAPWELHWRMRKRALTRRGERAPLTNVPFPPPPEDPPTGPIYGLFDDVVTTGQTLAWTRAALPRDVLVRPLTLASAREYFFRDSGRIESPMERPPRL